MIANSKFHKVFELKMGFNCLQLGVLVKSTKWFAIFSNTRGFGSSHLSNIQQQPVRGILWK